MKTTFTKKIFLTFSFFALLNSVSPTTTPLEKKEYKKLTCKEMNLLNTMFENKPILAVRMNSAYEAAEKTTQHLDSELEKIRKQIEETNKTDDKNISAPKKTPKQIEEEIGKKQLELVEKSKNKLLRPVKKFFIGLYKFKSLLRSLVVDIFNQDETYKKILAEGSKTPYFLQFLELEKEDTTDFFDKAIKDRDTMLEICNEFFTLFGPVTASMTDTARTKTEALTKELKKQSQKATAAKKNNK